MYVYKIYHIPSAIWYIAMSVQKYTSVQKIPTKLFRRCGWGQWGSDGLEAIARIDNTRILLTCGAFYCHDCPANIKQIESSEVLVFRGCHPCFNKAPLDPLDMWDSPFISVSNILKQYTNDIEWIELPYKE